MTWYDPFLRFVFLVSSWPRSEPLYLSSHHRQAGNLLHLNPSRDPVGNSRLFPTFLIAIPAPDHFQSHLPRDANPCNTNICNDSLSPLPPGLILPRGSLPGVSLLTCVSRFSSGCLQLLLRLSGLCYPPPAPSHWVPPLPPPGHVQLRTCLPPAYTDLAPSLVV